MEKVKKLMQYWLMKSEPFKYSWDQLVKDGSTHWDGVRNYEARNNMKAMEIGDQVFFYHSNEGLEIVGIAEVCKLFYPDPSDESGKFGMVDIKPVKPLPQPVPLTLIKSTDSLADMAILRRNRLSVTPVKKQEWDIICKLGGLN